MMHGNSWFNNSNCSFLGNNMFSIWNFLIMIGFVIIVAALILWFRRKNNNTNNQAINRLKELYVKGEITEEEYSKRKNVIEK